MNEATARIKINRLLEAAGWRMFADDSGPANVLLESRATITKSALDEFGDDFEKTSRGYVDFLLLDSRGFPLLVLEAKREDLDPLIAKEQTRTYARSQNCRFVILSNGNLHYFWDLERGNPHLIPKFPTPDSVVGYQRITPNPTTLVNEHVNDDYIVLTQNPTYASDASFKNEAEREDYIAANKLRFLRPYQLRAIHQLQEAVKDGKDRFLFEMATGTGKTLTAAAIVKLFLRSGNARRVLFLVDRLELEDQAKKAFVQLLSKDFQTVVYKENKDDWHRAEIVVTTVQSLQFNNKYSRWFSPTDFDLVISDEAHRSIGGNARAVFDFFIGYKLGLTATPKDYLRRFDAANPTTRDPREAERRLLADTYKTFGCESGQPTFRYTLLDGVREGYLINPIVVDARTEVTTQLLSEKGYIVTATDDEGEDQQEIFKQREYEKRFFSEPTNWLFCATFLKHALRDPISNEVGKSIVFAVSQKHATKLTQILNELIERVSPGMYQSDFAIQVTSQIPDAQQFTVQFANNNLRGSGNVMPAYRTSKARVCVTVGMMTTGYDCTDILNIGLFRPIFSPSDFVQIKGRGTRTHDFLEQLTDDAAKAALGRVRKDAFKLFDFFANCDFFETGYNYDEVLKLRKLGEGGEDNPNPNPPDPSSIYEHLDEDIIAALAETAIGHEGMRIDRMLFEHFGDVVRENAEIVAAANAGQWDRAMDCVKRDVFDKPEEYYNLDKLRKAAGVDRRLSLREILEYFFGFIPRFKSKEEVMDEKFMEFVVTHTPETVQAIPAIRGFFKAYLSDSEVRAIIDSGKYTELATNPGLTMREFEAVPKEFRTRVPEYIKDYISLNEFTT